MVRGHRGETKESVREGTVRLKHILEGLLLEI